MKPLLMGMIAMAAIVIAMFFTRYWRTTRDRLYLFFAASFAVQALDRFVLGIFGDVIEEQAMIYLLRSLAYSLIVVAIIDKNRSVPAAPPPPSERQQLGPDH